MTVKSESQRKRRGFERASGLLQGQIRQASETRGFAQSRLLTNWAEIVGEDTARMAVPIKIGYAQGGFGATLTVLCAGANAPILQAQLPKIKDRVNACYGYSAISRIRITQTAPTGFSEGQSPFQPAPKPTAKPDPVAMKTAHDLATTVNNPSLRQALEALGQNVLSRKKNPQEAQ